MTNNDSNFFQRIKPKRSFRKTVVVETIECLVFYFVGVRRTKTNGLLLEYIIKKSKSFYIYFISVENESL